MFTTQIIKPFRVVIGAGMLASIFTVAPAGAADSYPDGHAFVRASILNTWSPTSIAFKTAETMDAHERARLMIVGAPASTTVGAAAATLKPALDGHEQARRLLLSQPGDRGPGGTASLTSVGEGS